VVKSTDHEAHARTNALRIRYAAVDPESGFARPDEIESAKDEPGHRECGVIATTPVWFRASSPPVRLGAKRHALLSDGAATDDTEGIPESARF
jgi:hypothetical protein